MEADIYFASKNIYAWQILNFGYCMQLFNGIHMHSHEN